MSYRVLVELDAPSARYDVLRVAIVVGLALTEEAKDLVVSRMEVEHEDA